MREAEAEVDKRAARRALLAQAEAVIRQAYGDPELTLADVATELGVSARQLQRIFSEAGTTFSDRLEAVRMRTCPRVADSNPPIPPPQEATRLVPLPQVPEGTFLDCRAFSG